MAAHGYNQFPGAHGASIDPNDLAMAGNYSPNFQTNNGNYNNQNANNQSGFSSGNAILGDDELLDGLASPGEQPMGHGHEFGGMNMAYSHGAYGSHRGSLQIDPSQLNGYSNTPDGDPIQSPYAAGFNPGFRQMQNGMALGTSLHSPLSYSGSPLTAADMNDASDPNYLNAKARARMSAQMQRKASQGRSPMTPKSQAMHGMPIGSAESPGFGPQSMRTTGSHDNKTPPTQWLNTPSASIPASYQSGFSSPMQQSMVPMNEVMMKAGTSMPTKLGGVPTNAVSSQEMKRKRRRESHNLVERRRRDNINERIQDLSKLVPTHRLEDEKIRKLIQNGTPLSPTLTGIANASQATSGLAGPGARRATGASAGNITTGLPIEDKDKGPNKGDILNGAVSWTRDLMWMLHLKLQQHEELMNVIRELGGQYPFEATDDEMRMHTELFEAIDKNETDGSFSYSRTNGSGLRVPSHTDYRGDPLNGVASTGNLDMGTTPEDGNLNTVSGDLRDTDQFWHDPDEVGSGHNSLDFKEEDEYEMDLTQ